MVHTERQQRDDDFRAEIELRSVRTEAAGMDRHHRRYWLFRSLKSCLCVEEANGLSIACISNQEELSDLVSRLNDRGTRECGLLASLHAANPTFSESPDNPNVFIDLEKVKASMHADESGGKGLETSLRENETNHLKAGEEQIEKLINELARVGVKLDIGIKVS